MQEAQLVPLLSNNDEDSVPEVPDLGQVEDVKDVSNGGVDDVERLAGEEGIVAAVGDEEGLEGHVGAHHHLGHVVQELERVGVDLGNEGEL